MVAGFPWAAAPPLLRDYLTPAPGRGLFPFFPCAAYVAFGLAAGGIVKRAPADRLDRLMQWAVLAGFGMISGGQYFSNIPYSLYAKSDFWTNGPALIFIRVGIALPMMAAA